MLTTLKRLGGIALPQIKGRKRKLTGYKIIASDDIKVPDIFTFTETLAQVILFHSVITWNTS
jgi:hypothetical protein